MIKRGYRKFLIIVLLVGTLVGGGVSIWNIRYNIEKQEVSTDQLSDEMLIPGGMPIGIYLETDGVLVLGTENMEGVDGLFYEPAEYLVKEGDYIVGINHKTIASKRELIDEVENLDKKEVVLTIRRNEEELDVKLIPVEVKADEYKLGIWVRDNSQGLGTMTYLNTNSEFGALGHGIHDVDTDELLNISEGKLYKTSIQSIQKGKAGTPGGLEGLIVYNDYNVLGEITENTEAGIFGRVDNIPALFEDQEPVEICKKEDIKTGKAVVRCAVDGTLRDYEVQIIRVELYNRDVNKGIVLKVTDKKLLELTGGIVQGMSGSPILQDGKIVGAVTHVFVNDPTSGYGIFIENMLNK